MVARPVSTSLGLEGQGQTEPDKNAGNLKAKEGFSLVCESVHLSNRLVKRRRRERLCGYWNLQALSVLCVFTKLRQFDICFESTKKYLL